MHFNVTFYIRLSVLRWSWAQIPNKMMKIFKFRCFSLQYVLTISLYDFDLSVLKTKLIRNRYYQYLS